ncbi:MAG: hypothetical protein AAFY56_07875 [Pseudomonadota bacterium]
MNSVLEQFIRDTGVEDLTEDFDAPLVLRLESSGRLFFEGVDGHTLVYLESGRDHADVATLERALRACDIKARLPVPVRAALGSHDHVVFGVRFADEALTTQLLHQTVDLLIDMEREILG